MLPCCLYNYAHAGVSPGRTLELEYVQGYITYKAIGKMTTSFDMKTNDT